MTKKAHFLMAGLGVLLCAGCDPDVADLDAREMDQPLMKRAAERVEEGDVDSAVRLYIRAIEEDPAAARGHLDVALLLDDYKQDYVAAIYHYRRYLELRENTEKRGMIEERIRRAEHLFAASVVVPSQQSGLISSLEKENASLKTNVRTLTRRVSVLQSELDAIQRNLEDRERLALSPDGTRPTTYTVKPGDSLTKIAARMYGDPKRWPDIHKANRELLGRSTNVRPGQTLKLP